MAILQPNSSEIDNDMDIENKLSLNSITSLFETNYLWNYE